MTLGKVINEAGLKEIPNLHGYGLGGIPFRYVALGIGTTTPAPSDTQLASEIGTSGSLRRAATVSIDPVDTGDATETTVMFTATWLPGAIVLPGNPTIVITELGLFNGETAGTLNYPEVR